MVKVHCKEGVAIHFSPESCALFREEPGEALTEVRAGSVLSLEMRIVSGADAVRVRGRQHLRSALCESPKVPAGSETRCTHVRISHGSREIPPLTYSRELWARALNPKGARVR